MIIYLSLVVALIGAFMFFTSDPAKHPDMKEFGRITYFAGLLVFLFQAVRIVGSFPR
jgi:hypothetical protein